MGYAPERVQDGITQFQGLRLPLLRKQLPDDVVMLLPVRMRASVKPLMAEQTRMVRSRSTARVTISATRAMLAALATEEPPNLSTCMMYYVFY